MTVQPIVFYSLPQGFYLRSASAAGKVMQIGKATVNAFIEPQVTVYKCGEQVPHRQIFAGLNLQF